MIPSIIAFFTTSAIGRTLAKIGAVLLAIVTFGAWQRRHGAQGQKAKQAEAQHKADTAAHERMNNAPTGADLSDAERREWLRKYAAKHKSD